MLSTAPLGWPNETSDHLGENCLLEPFPQLPQHNLQGIHWLIE